MFIQFFFTIGSIDLVCDKVCTNIIFVPFYYRPSVHPWPPGAGFTLSEGPVQVQVYLLVKKYVNIQHWKLKTYK